ncbi:MAG: hypothetical protein K2X27_17085 [Candidatus Obscuribacterales bacterium]|nr:hypothetical protein [Candidatus Obscuribacterales bacterium]
MVICPIAKAVHCTGCLFVKFCPLKSVLGDFGKEKAELPGASADSKQVDEKVENGKTNQSQAS